jgi:hypothetical protein
MIGFLLVLFQSVLGSRRYEKCGEGEVDLSRAALSEGNAQEKIQSRLKECDCYRPARAPTFVNT